MPAHHCAVAAGDNSGVFQHRQRVIQGRGTQRRVAPPVDQLVTLYDELDLPNPAAAEFDITGKRFLGEFPFDQRLHGPDGLEGAEVEVFPVNERPKVFQKIMASGNVAGDRACLDQRITLPVPTVGQKIMIHGVEGQRQRSAFPVGAKPHIDPEDDALIGGCLQDINQRLPELDKELMVADGSCTIGCPVFPVGKDKIDI